MDNFTLYNTLNLSSLIYSKESEVKYPLLNKIHWINNKSSDTQGVIMEDAPNKKLYIAFRGTESEKDMLTDAKCFQKTVVIFGSECKVHDGFWKAYDSVKNEVNSIINNSKYNDYEIITCGHSLGGALAILCAINTPINCKVKTVAYGSPLVGDSKFVKVFNNRKIECIRLIHGNDVVPMVPNINYKHCGEQIRVDNDGNQIGYMNFWKRLIYWIKGKRKMDYDILSVDDHHMVNYVKAITKWLGKRTIA
jgi:hypothetical protein